MPQHPVYSPLRFWVFMLAAGVSVLADMVFSFVLILHSSDLALATGHSWMVLETELMALLPPILVGPFLGGVADRFDPLRIWRTTLGLQALVFLVMPLLAEHFHAMVACLAVLNGVLVVSAGAAFKVLPRYSGPERLTRASSTWTAIQSAAMLPSAPVGGFLYGVLDLRGVLVLDAVGFLVVLVVLFLTPPPFATGSGAAEGEPADGAGPGPEGDRVVGWIFRHPVMGLLILPVFFVVLSTSVAGVFFVRGLAPNAVLFGLALASWSLGMIPGSHLGGRLVDTADNRLRYTRLVPVRTLLLGAGVVMGVVLSLEALAPNMWVVLVLFIIGGSANGVINVAMRSAVYEYVPERSQGRTWAYWHIVSNGAAVVGMVLGTPNQWWGATGAIMASGLVCLIGCGAFAVTGLLRRPEADLLDTEPVPAPASKENP